MYTRKDPIKNLQMYKGDKEPPLPPCRMLTDANIANLQVL